MYVCKSSLAYGVVEGFRGALLAQSLRIISCCFWVSFLLFLESEMAQRSHVPKFGSWESEGNVHYTAYFDKVGRGRNEGRVIKPNDPEEKPDISHYVADKASPSQMNALSEKPISQGAERQRSREDDNLKQFSYSPAHHDHINRRGSEPAPRYGSRGVSSVETHKRPIKTPGPENSIERSPLHHQARNGRGVRAPPPAREGKGSYEGTPGRPQKRPTASGNGSSNKSAAVPIFGDWDEKDPESADRYTDIFNKVREERQTARVPGIQNESYHDYHRSQTPNKDNAKCCCFPWGRK